MRPVAIAQTRPLRQSVLRPHQTLEQLACEEPTDVFAVGAFAAEEPIAVGLIAPDGQPGGWRIRGMATAPDARGQGAGTAVLEALLQHAIGNGARLIWCNARTPARSFYERGGLTVVSEEFELPQIGPHLVMELRLEESGA